jgi:hypothetical protein
MRAVPTIFDPSLLRAEQAVVFWCLRGRVIGDGAKAELKALLTQKLDWDYLFNFARRHAVLPLVIEHLSLLASSVPPREFARFRTYYQENTARNILLGNELKSILQALSNAGIEAVPYKGPALAVFAYGRLSSRWFVDLDIMVRKRDVPRAKEILCDLGYVSETAWTKTQQSVLLRTQHNLALRGEGGRLIVELHWEVASGLFAQSLKAEELWSRLETMQLDGMAIKTLSASDLLLSLCVHGSRHLWERLCWICDIAELIRSPRALDWPNLLAQAKLSGNSRMFRLGLMLASNFLAAPLPHEIQADIADDDALNPLALEIAERLFSGTEHLPVTASESFRYNLQIRESWGARLRYFRLMFQPTDSDVRAIALPPGMTFAYYLVRPLRLFRSDHERRLIVQRSIRE